MITYMRNQAPLMGFKMRNMITKEEAVEIIKTRHIAEGLIAFALYNGASAICMKKELYVKKVDEHWTIKCNGRNKKINTVPPFSWSIEFNGWPAGILSITGEGVLCAGEAGNEDNLRNALLSSVESMKQTTANGL